MSEWETYKLGELGILARGKDERIVLFNETEHRKRSLLKEYETYIKAKTA
jgi:hypothetical protein